ncbi:MAG: YjbQ family protein [Candidatus Altiarchaeales archaeon]|nr:MAG: YjbQ family protein [Candidatus Altiarchaeales archaeon]RLI94868.1 MAG: YjbQ family protein [Candidatus Altiarchaeales archaeon]RLI94973.1 MAG: YjbQ family protein [Candidatus Altiarchaeales archaeon]HDO82090.1 YjbQ family protein [Candidatus Altiarchaeales archaeon]HEX54739.1 YjbQ family protein [Candidatus Altiarchaeales archaeon]
MIRTEEIEIDMQADGDTADITSEVQRIIENSKISNGIAVIFMLGSTGAVSTMEYEPGLKRDIKAAFERIAPSDIHYEHHKTWHDDNGRSHIRATFIGPSVVVPFINKKLTLGTWQQIIAINLDTRPRRRRIVVQIIGE